MDLATIENHCHSIKSDGCLSKIYCHSILSKRSVAATLWWLRAKRVEWGSLLVTQRFSMVFQVSFTVFHVFWFVPWIFKEVSWFFMVMFCSMIHFIPGHAGHSLLWPSLAQMIVFQLLGQQWLATIENHCYSINSIERSKKTSTIPLCHFTVVYVNPIIFFWQMFLRLFRAFGGFGMTTMTMMQ